jgi:thiol-disulfide isomerase/thioredoxin
LSTHLPRLALIAAGLSLMGAQWYLKPDVDRDTIARMRGHFTRQSDWAGRLAPDFTLRQLDGASFTLADHIGQRVIVLNFFATWCGPCRAEMPELERYQAARRTDPFLLLAIDVEERPEVVQRYVAQQKLGMPVALDETGDVTRLYEVNAYPTTVVIGADGRVLLYQMGAIANADVAFDNVVPAQIAALRAGKGIGRDAWLAALGKEPPRPATTTARREARTRGPALEGRAKAIVEKMACPCGCSDQLVDCGCKTAQAIKARLVWDKFENQSDAQVMEALNKEFCMKGM